MTTPLTCRPRPRTPRTVMAIIATVAAVNRQWYRYPLTLRLVH
ncbi:MAG: hypothetical protein JWN35_1857 [Frankiales bacterium]|jgi:hypothetical protein|nr:hypothetical protein [Frankiales bacterium]